MKSTLAFLAAGAAATAAATTAVFSALSLKRRPAKQPSPKSTLIHPTSTHNRCISGANINTTNKNNDDDDNTFHVLKDPVHPSRDTTCLVRFDLAAGRTYQLDFHLSNGETTRLLSTGSQTVDVFSTVDSASSHPARDRHLARLAVREGGTEWLDVGLGTVMGMDNSKAPLFEAQGRKSIALEFVGVGDAVEVLWRGVDMGVGPVMRDNTS